MQEANSMALKAELMEKSADSPIHAKEKGRKVAQVPGNNNTNKWQGTKGATEGNSHTGDKGRFRRPNPYAKPYGDHCYYCSKPSHKSTDCPNRRQVNLAEANEDDNEDHGADEEYEGADFAYEKGDELINLVLHQVLLTPRQEEGQRHKIFRSFCTVNNKVYNLIIDGGSCENLISKKVMDYLKFPTEKHESPYSLRLVKRGPSVQVTEVCKAVVHWKAL
ncbi:unnamed protein product [Prunus armeniaca]